MGRFVTRADVFVTWSIWLLLAVINHLQESMEATSVALLVSPLASLMLHYTVVT